MSKKLHLLILSPVSPFPGNSGQQRRVYYKLKALRERFQLTFCGLTYHEDADAIKKQLLTLCDRVIVLPSRYSRHPLGKVWHRALGVLHTLRTGLKWSNYLIGELGFSPSCIQDLFKADHFDCVLFEYWHTVESTSFFQCKGIPCVLDMHDVLWQSYDRQLVNHPYPWMRGFRSRLVQAYRQREEAAWARYDALIAISTGEAEYVRRVVPKRKIFVAPMGIDLNKWPYCWSPARPPRFAFYGSLGSRQNQESVWWCLERIMPLIWHRLPNVEFWIVGANPTREILALTRDVRVHVTGFVPDVVPVLSTMTGVLCPWRGTYGFRSRVIEIMALGIPVVATRDAVYGMGIESNKGICLFETDEELAKCSITLIEQLDWARQQSRLARQQIEDKFGFGDTYGHLARELDEFVRSNRDQAGGE